MAQSFIGAGDVYVDRLTGAGSSQGFVKVGAGKMEIKPNTELKEQISKGYSSYGQVIASVAVNKPAELTVSLTQVDRKALAIAFLGDDANYAVTAGSVAAGSPEAITAHEDKVVFLAHRSVSAVVVKDVTDVTTYVSGTDYTVDSRTGGLTALSTGSINDGDVLHVSYAYTAEAGYKIQGATQPLVKMAIHFDGKNMVDNGACLLDVWEATVSPDSAVDFLADDWAEITLKGSMVTPTGKASPFELIMLDVA